MRLVKAAKASPHAIFYNLSPGQGCNDLRVDAVNQIVNKVAMNSSLPSKFL